MLNYCVAVMLIAFTAQKALTQDMCGEFGAVRLISGYIPSNGIVEFCDGSHWGRVCYDGWDDNDAAVVCRELGYTADDAVAGNSPHRPHTNFVIRNVNCSSADHEARLHYCPYLSQLHCDSHTDAGVLCRAFKTVNATPYDTVHSVLITWEYHRHNNTSRQLISFYVECSSEHHGHYTGFSVSNGTFRKTIGGLLPFTSYNCCVSAIYYGRYGILPDRYYAAEHRCTLIEVMDSITNAAPNEMSMSLSSVDSNMRANIIGGVLGFIIVILVLLLAICGGVLLYLLRSKTPGVVSKRSPQPHGANTTDMYVGRNISYVAAPSHSTTSGSQAPQATRAAGNQDETGAAAEYSRIGPSYATIDNNSRGQQPVAGRNRVSARLSERYEFSEAHLAMASGGGGGGGQGEAAMEYEIPLQSGEHEEYSHLQH